MTDADHPIPEELEPLRLSRELERVATFRGLQAISEISFQLVGRDISDYDHAKHGLHLKPVGQNESRYVEDRAGIKDAYIVNRETGESPVESARFQASNASPGPSCFPSWFPTGSIPVCFASLPVTKTCAKTSAAHGLLPITWLPGCPDQPFAQMPTSRLLSVLLSLVRRNALASIATGLPC